MDEKVQSSNAGAWFFGGCVVLLLAAIVVVSAGQQRSSRSYSPPLTPAWEESRPVARVKKPVYVPSRGPDDGMNWSRSVGGRSAPVTVRSREPLRRDTSYEKRQRAMFDRMNDDARALGAISDDEWHRERQKNRILFGE